MDSVLCALCLDVFDRVMMSPLGRSIDNYFEQLPGLENLLTMEQIKQKLLQQKYTSIDEYIAEVEDTVAKLARHFDSECEVVLALQNLRFMILEQSKGLRPGNNQNWKDSLSALVDNLGRFCQTAPNSEREFSAFVMKDYKVKDKSQPENPPTAPEISHIDLKKLKSMIYRLPTDEDEHELFELIQHMEPGFAKPHRLVEVDLRKLYPETIHRIYQFVLDKKCYIAPDGFANSPFFILPDQIAGSGTMSSIPTPVPTPRVSFAKDDPQ